MLLAPRGAGTRESLGLKGFQPRRQNASPKFKQTDGKLKKDTQHPLLASMYVHRYAHDVLIHTEIIVNPLKSIKWNKN